MPDTYEKIQELLAEGLSQVEVAERLGVSTSTVSRQLANHRADNGFRDAQDAVDTFIASLGDTDPDVRARAEVLRSLARKLDWASQANTGTAAMAAANLAKEFRALVDELKQVASFDELRRALLADD
jgi:predicted transcriptional regulator